MEEARQAGREHLLHEQVEELVDQEKNFFCLILFQHINHIGNAAKRQRFEVALVLDGKGLSDTGRDILSKMDVCLSHGAFLDYKERYIYAAEIAIGYSPCVCGHVLPSNRLFR
jgi:hypothetical protein